MYARGSEGAHKVARGVLPSCDILRHTELKAARLARKPGTRKKSIYCERMVPAPAFRWQLFLILLTLHGVVTLVDYATGPRLLLTPFYLLAVLIGGWHMGRLSAWLLTAIVGITLLSLDVWAGGWPDWVRQWNLATRVGLFGAMGHLTAQVRLDRDQLNELLAERTSAYAAALDQLRHRDRLALVGQLASGLAHEFGTPLNVIVGRARLITDPDTTTAEAEKHARSIIEQAERVTAIIRQLLDFARRRGPELGRTDLHELSARVLELIRPLAEKRRVELALMPSTGSCVAAVDYNQIQQAVSNLIMNGIQAMPSGGKLIVSVAGSRDKKGHAGVTLSVKDSGTGIAPENLKRIFEPFFTTQSAGVGTGLGLSITEGIVRDHLGKIEVESDLGQGSTFRIFIPCEPAQGRVEDVK